MTPIRRLLLVLSFAGAPLLWGNETASAPPPAGPPAEHAAGAESKASAAAATRAPESTEQARLSTEVGAIAGSGRAVSRPPDFLEHLVDVVLGLFDVRSSGNTVIHYLVAALFLVGSFLLRHVCTNIVFRFLRRWAEKTETTLDDKLFPALESPVAALISVTGAVAALKVLKLSESSDRAVSYLSTVAFSLAVFWILLRAFNALLDHAHEVALAKQMGIAAFMPWIKKALIVIFVLFGSLLVAQSLGADVKAFLAGLGLGGLAFALAAQDTIANVFGSVVVAIDQPFRIGDYVRIGVVEGSVEDIGLRSTRIRTPARTLITVPNKTVANEAINNFTRMAQRRVDQNLGLTYDTKPEQMQAVLDDIRAILRRDPDVQPESSFAYFSDYGDSSLTIVISYFTRNPEWNSHMMVRERINLAFLRAVASRGLSFAFPTRTIQFDSATAQRLRGADR